MLQDYSHPQGFKCVHCGAIDAPRLRRLAQRGWSNLANDRPSVLGMAGRQSRQVRLQVIPDTAHATLDALICQWTQTDTLVYSDDGQGYNNLTRAHAQANHHKNEWVRDDDGDDIREVHAYRIAGLWTGLRPLLRPFREVSKH